MNLRRPDSGRYAEANPSGARADKPRVSLAPPVRVTWPGLSSGTSARANLPSRSCHRHDHRHRLEAAIVAGGRAERNRGCSCRRSRHAAPCRRPSGSARVTARARPRRLRSNVTSSGHPSRADADRAPSSPRCSREARRGRRSTTRAGACRRRGARARARDARYRARRGDAARASRAAARRRSGAARRARGLVRLARRAGARGGDAAAARPRTERRRKPRRCSCVSACCSRGRARREPRATRLPKRRTLNPADPVAPETRAALAAWAPAAVSPEQAAESYLVAAERREAQGDRAGAFEDLMRAFEIAPACPAAAERLAAALLVRAVAGAPPTRSAASTPPRSAARGEPCTCAACARP